MIQKTKAIVLHHLKYSETSVILTLYTKEYGRQSYMINGIRSAKSKQKMGLLQPLFLLEIDAYHKPGRDVQRMKEFKIAEIYNSIPYDIVKSTMAMFLAEMLHKVIRSEEPDKNLFEYIFRSLHYFDSLEKGSPNFHLWFLTQLLSHLGFRLENNYSDKNCWFDVKNGFFVNQRPTFPNTPDIEESELLSQLVAIDVEDIALLAYSGKQRTRLLEIIVEYYMIHFDGIGTINSLKILHEIYH